MDSRVYSNQSWIQIYNDGKTLNQFLKVLYGANRCYPSNLALYDCFHTFADVFNITAYFNLYWDTIINIVHALVYHGHYTMGDLMNQEWFFVKYLYDRLEQEIEEENERREKEAKEQEKQNMAYQQQQQQMYRSMMPSMPNMPSM